MTSRLPNKRALYRLGVRDRAALLETLARRLQGKLAMMERVRSPYPMLKNVRRRLRRVYKAADAFGHYVGQPSSGVTSPAFMRLMERARARYAIEVPSFDPDEMPEPKPRVRVKAISERVAA